MNLEELWTDLIRQLKSYPNVNASQIDAFFSRVQVQAASQGFVMFTSDNSFIKDWIEKHYIKDIQQALKDLYGFDFVVQIEVDPTSTPVAPLPETPQGQSTLQGQQQNQTPQLGTYQNAQQTSYSQNNESLRMPPQQEGQSNNTHTTIPVGQRPVLNEYPGQAANEQNYKKQPQDLTEDQVSIQSTNTQQKGANSLTFENFVIGDSNRSPSEPAAFRSSRIFCFKPPIYLRKKRCR